MSDRRGAEARRGKARLQVSARRIAGEAALALGAGPELERQAKFVLSIDGEAARGRNLPDVTVYHDRASRHQAVPRPALIIVISLRRESAADPSGSVTRDSNRGPWAVCH